MERGETPIAESVPVWAQCTEMDSDLKSNATGNADLSSRWWNCLIPPCGFIRTKPGLKDAKMPHCTQNKTEKLPGFLQTKPSKKVRGFFCMNCPGFSSFSDLVCSIFNNFLSEWCFFFYFASLISSFWVHPGGEIHRGNSGAASGGSSAATGGEGEGEQRAERLREKTYYLSK